MTSLVTLDQAKAHLKMDHDYDDDQIEDIIQAASGAVLNYLDEAQFDYVDTSGELIADVPYVIQQATLLMVGYFYKNVTPASPDAVDPKFGYGYLPLAVTAILYPYRTPPIG